MVRGDEMTERAGSCRHIHRSGATISDALPDLKLTGLVTEIADMFTVQSGDILYKVRLLVEQPDPQLRWGMTVETTFNP
jgi:hypothetical protein